MHTQCLHTMLGEGENCVVDPRSACWAVPDFDSLSFEDAVRLFEQWGFQVEPGPRPEEVTLILEGPDYRTCSVHDGHILPKMAAVALRARWQNGTLTRPREQRGRRQRAASRELAELVC